MIEEGDSLAQITITPEMTVGAVVAEYPATVRMFEALGIDYCCEGKRALTDAAQAAQMPVDALLAVLRTTIEQAQQAPAIERDWQAASLDELIDYIIDVTIPSCAGNCRASAASWNGSRRHMAPNMGRC